MPLSGSLIWTFGISVAPFQKCNASPKLLNSEVLWALLGSGTFSNYAIPMTSEADSGLY